MHQRAIRLFSLVMLILGLAILTTTFANGGGPLSTGTLLGIAFLAVGLARLWLSGIFRGRRDRTRGQGHP